MIINNCILCDVAGEPFGTKPDYNDYTIGEASGVRRYYNFLKCPKCDLWWVKDPNDNYEDLYASEEYWWDYHKRRGWNSLDEAPRIENDIKYSKLRIPEIKRHIASGTVLEIGCSTGTMLKELKDNDFHCVGIEPNHRVAKQASDYANCKVLPSLDKIYKKYDMLIALDVLEHIQNPLETVKNWVEKVINNGIIMIELPDASCEGAIKHGIDWDYAIPMEHIYYYKPDHVIELFDKFGCTLIEFSNPWTTDRQRFFFKKD